MVLKSGLVCLTPEEIRSIPTDFYQHLGLEELLTRQRLHGIAATLAHMKLLALKNIEK